MEIELWWLLALPLFFGLGWVAARIDQVFMRALLLLVAAFVLALVYRWITSRWTRGASKGSGVRGDA